MKDYRYRSMMESVVMWINVVLFCFFQCYCDPRDLHVLTLSFPTLRSSDLSGWLRNVRTAFAGGADVVQGAVHADPAGVDSMGPWDHTIWVDRKSTRLNSSH